MIKKVKMLKERVVEGFKKKKVSGFTLLEMLVVLLIIGVLILLFVPNLTKHRETISDTEKEAITKVVETQWELYRLENPSETGEFDSSKLNVLVNAKYLDKKQVDSYKKQHNIPITDE